MNDGKVNYHSLGQRTARDVTQGDADLTSGQRISEHIVRTRSSLTTRDRQDYRIVGADGRVVSTTITRFAL